jgi:hypothetical protein
MYNKTKNSFLSKRSLNIGIAFVVVALVAGVYFLFRPFPAGPSLEVKAKVPEAASVAGWSAYANAPLVVKAANSKLPQLAADADQKLSPGQGSAQGFMLGGSLFPVNPSSNVSSIQRLDIGSGYVLETNAQGTRIVAPSAPSVSSYRVQKLDIGSGYVLETQGSAGRIIAPATPASVKVLGSGDERNFAPASTVQDLDIGAGYVLETDAQGTRIVLPATSLLLGEKASAISVVQRLDIGAGYVLETDAQGTRIVAPTTLQMGSTTQSKTEVMTKIDIGSGYMLVMGPGNQGEIVPAR